MTRPTVCFVHADAIDIFRGENGARFGGAETQIYLMARALADDGTYNVRFAVDREVDGAAYPGIEFRSARSPIQRGVPILSRFLNHRRATAPFDGVSSGVLVQTIAAHSAARYRELCARLGLKYVYRMSCDADIDGSLFGKDTSGRKAFFAALKSADGVIAQTRAQEERLLAEHGVTATVVPNIVELPRSAPEPDGGCVLWVGRAAPLKRPWIAIETARVMPQHRFVMVMPPEDPIFFDSVMGEARRVPNLTVVPGVRYGEMGEYYADAALLIGTSVVEGFPNVYLQAAAHGKPIVSLDVDPGGMLTEAGAGVYAHGDVDGFREDIDALLTDQGRIRQLGLAAEDFVRQNHSVDAVMPQLTSFIDRVIRGS